MAKCSKDNCKKTAGASGLCADHERLKKQADETNKRIKEQEAKALADKQDAMKKAAELQKKNQEKADAKKKRIPEIATLWNNQIKPLVTAVESLRKLNPTKSGINAGTNSDVVEVKDGPKKSVTIVGGTNNPLTLTLPSDAAGLGITKADVLPTINGWKGSDSGCYKFERGDKVFIHCK